ncbi:MAG: hypothetical protein ACHP79_04685, partial [Terriglobales bacterium]
LEEIARIAKSAKESKLGNQEAVGTERENPGVFWQSWQFWQLAAPSSCGRGSALERSGKVTRKT